MRQLIIAAVLTLITACTGITKKPIPVPIPSAAPIPKADNQIVEKKLNDIPRSLKISMTLSNPDDLKVKSGQLVKAGEILSDRVGEKQSLLEKRFHSHSTTRDILITGHLSKKNKNTVR